MSVLLTLALALVSTSAFAQGGGSAVSLSGTVVDKDGGVIPGATVVIKNKATGESMTVVTNGEGKYSAPSLTSGTYSVTVSLSGFKTIVHDDVRLLVATSSNLKTTLEIGQISETVNVRANTELVRTQQTSVTSSMSTEAIQNLPIVIRNMLNFVTFLPGVETTGTARNSTIMGLPQAAINLSIDGSSVSNAFQSGDGFYAQIFPKLDAIEEVTMTGAGSDAMGASQGTIQVKFVTRSGTNQFRGTAYEYMRRKEFNSNYFFNKVNGLDRNAVNIDQFGVSEGGPIVLPGLYDGRGKAFFFFNMEEFHLPNELTTTRTVLTPEAQQGIFRYTSSSGLQTVDLFALMANSGNSQIIGANTPDPAVTALLAKIRTATTKTGVTLVPANQTSVNTLNYLYQAPGTRIELTPTQKVDFNLTPQHRLSGTYYWQRITYHPDLLNSSQSRFPGFVNQGNQDSFRTTGSVTLRSTLGSGIVNEAIGAWQWSPVQFNPNIAASDFNDQANVALTFPIGTSAFVTRNQAPRNTPTWNIDDNVSWLKGNHSLSFGGNYTSIHHIQNSLDVVPAITLGFDTTNDPARGVFTNTANFPGSPSNAILNDARAVYALLTGRVASINGTARLNADGTEYVYNGNLHQESKMGEFGLYGQDSWKLSPTFTLNYGVRWEVLVPFTTVTPNWTMSTIADLCGPSGTGAGPGGRECNLFKPGVFGNATQIPTYTPFTPGTPGYDMNYKNLAPNVGAAWRPNVQNGLLRHILGDPEQAVIRAAFSKSFNRPRMDEFTGLFTANPGGTAPGGANRSTAAGNFPLYAPGVAPLLLSETSRLGPPAFVTSPTFPILASLAGGNDINVFTQNIKIPYVNTWSIGLSRAVGRDMAVDVRYTGNQAKNSWDTENWNVENIQENGFLSEFKLAQANLQTNIAQGRGATFRHFAFGDTSPLPIYLAYLSGTPMSQASDPTLYTSTDFSNGTLVNRLNPINPSPFAAAGTDLWGNATRRTNSFNAGVATNFFVLNPLVDDANVTRNVEGSYYHSFTLEVRRRLSHGLLVQGNYVYAQRFAATIQQGDFHRDFEFFRNTGTPPHTYKFLWTYQLPFGRGQRWGTNMGRLADAAFGGWEWSGTGRVQQNIVRFRGKIVGMSAQEVQDNFKIRFATDPTTGRTQVFSMSQDIIDQSRNAFDTSATSSTGYGSNGPPTGKYLAPAGGNGCFYLFVGDCGEQEYYFKLPLFSRVDMTLKKKFQIASKTSFSLQFDVLNVFDNVNFTHNFNPGGSWQVQNAYTDPNGTYDPGGRLGQVVFRLNW
jgi:hypothetical protein